MKTTSHYLITALIVAARFGTGVFAAETNRVLTAQVAEAKDLVIGKDPGFKAIFEKAAGCAIFPAVAKGGLSVGAARGKGQVFEKEKLAGEATLTQLSGGFQAGGRS